MNTLTPEQLTALLKQASGNYRIELDGLIVEYKNDRIETIMNSFHPSDFTLITYDGSTIYCHDDEDEPHYIQFIEFIEIDNLLNLNELTISHIETFEFASGSYIWLKLRVGGIERQCEYKYVCGTWMWYDGEDEPPMSDELLELFHGKKGDEVISHIYRFSDTVTLSIDD